VVVRTEAVGVGSQRSEVPRAEVGGAGSLRPGAAQDEITRAALQAIDACVGRLNPDIDIGYDRVVARCPALARRLDEGGWGVWLPRDWQRAGNDLSAGGLRELRELISRELVRTGVGAEADAGAGGGVRGRVPSVERVHEDQRAGWWGRVKTWLRGVFGRPEPAADEGWLARMIGQSGLSQAVIELISYVALGLVAVLAVVIVANELLVSGVFGSLRRRLAVLADAPIASLSEGLAWGDVAGAPLLRRPGLLLELLVARLAEGSRLRSGRGLTVRELMRAVRLSGEEERERFAKLAGIAERLRFSGVGVSGGEIEAAVESGRVLLERVAQVDEGAEAERGQRDGSRSGGVRGGSAGAGRVRSGELQGVERDGAERGVGKFDGRGGGS
jgi:hypothetical protein